jgi:hypothetical protein
LLLSLVPLPPPLLLLLLLSLLLIVRQAIPRVALAPSSRQCLVQKTTPAAVNAAQCHPSAAPLVSPSRSENDFLPAAVAVVSLPVKAVYT